MGYPNRRRIVVSNFGLSYIRIKKVASTSITHAMTDGRQIIGEEAIPGNFTFAVIRDPVDRFISAWNHHKGPTQAPHKQIPLQEFINLMPEGPKGLGMEDNHFIAQEWFLEGHKIDCIFTLDCLPSMWRYLQEIAPSLPDLPHYNCSGAALTCTPEERGQIEALYA